MVWTLRGQSRCKRAATRLECRVSRPPFDFHSPPTPRMNLTTASYGIGTFFSNDFKKASDPSQISKPLNIVIKLNKINGKDCVKLSDDKGKYTGNVEEVKRVQRELGLSPEHEEQRRG